MDSLFPGLSAALDLHPLLVHFPVAFWLAAAVLLPLGWLRDTPRWADAGRLLLWLGTGAAVVAAVTGYLASERMGHDAPGHDLVHVHRNFMLVATGVAVLASGVAWKVRELRGRGAALVAGLALVVGLLTGLGADRGAHLVYAYGMGVADAPPAAAEGDDHGGHAHGRHDHGGHDH